MTKKIKIQKENVSNICTTSMMSYEKYLKAAFEIISPNLSLRIYKLAPQEEYPFFERGMDLRVRIYWKKESVYEFIIEKSFFYQSNRNKEDRQYMRSWADMKVKMIKDAIIKPKPKNKKSCGNKCQTSGFVPDKNRKKKTKIGSTQDVFEKMKTK